MNVHIFVDGYAGQFPAQKKSRWESELLPNFTQKHDFSCPKYYSNERTNQFRVENVVQEMRFTDFDSSNFWAFWERSET